MRLSERCLSLEMPKHDFWGRGVTALSSYTMASLPWMMMIRSRARATPTECNPSPSASSLECAPSSRPPFPRVGMGVARPAERVWPLMTILTTATADSGGDDSPKRRTRRRARTQTRRCNRQANGRPTARDEAAQRVRRRAPVLRDDTHLILVARIGTASEGDVELVEIAV